MDDCKVCGKHCANYQPWIRIPEERLCMSCMEWLHKVLRDSRVILAASGSMILCPF